MKKAVFTLLACLLAGSLLAQKYAFVNTETIFSNLPEYKTAQNQISALQEKYQQELESEYAALEALFNQYQNEKAALSANQKKMREQNILDKEEQVKQLKESYFGQEGIMATKSQELFQPIQERVQTAVELVAKAGGYGMVIDVASGMNILYYNQDLDISNLVLEKLRIIK